MGQSSPICKYVVVFLWLFFFLAYSQLAFAKATYQSRFQPRSKEVRITLYDRIPPFDIQTNNAWSRIVPKNTNIILSQTPDHPQLPEMEYWISVPQGTVLKNVTVTAQAESRKLDLPLAPVQKPYIYKPGVTAPALSADPLVYQSHTEHPDTWHDHEIRRMGSTNVLMLKVRLFKYIGAQKKLMIYREPKIQVLLEVPHWDSNGTPKNIVDQEIKRKLVNSDEAFFNNPLR